MAEVVNVKKIAKNGSHFRFFVVVGKTVSKKAIERNKVKRRLRVIARDLLKKHENARIVLTAKKGAAEKTFAELKLEAFRAMEKVV